MKNSKIFLIKTLIVYVFLLINFSKIQAQQFKTAIDYISYMSNIHKEINKNVWQFVSASAHSKHEKKIEMRKSEMLNTVKTSEDKIKQMSDFKGSTELRDSMADYLDLVYKVMNEDYQTIIDLEAAAEDSYDLMETYLKVKDLANKKLDEAGQRIENTEKRFAEKNNINLTTELSEIGKKLEEANKVIIYYNKVYLIFFKAYKQSEFMWDNYGKNDFLAAQQSQGNLLKFAQEGIESLKSVQSYKGDGSLKKSCSEILQFYVKQDVPFFTELSDYNIKKEQFDKIKKIMDSKNQKDLSEAEVKEYNQKVNDLNNSSKKINGKTESQNKKRNDLTDNWNKTAKTFLDNNVP
jgi:hypothetical protein